MATIPKNQKFFCAKDRILNAFTATAFKKHYNVIVNQRHTNKKSHLFYPLPSTTNRKESINQYRDNVNLIPVGCCYENFKKYLPNKITFSTSFGFER